MKKLLVMAFACAATAVASASEIYWMVSNAPSSGDWTVARLIATEGRDHNTDGDWATLATLSKDDVSGGAIGIVTDLNAYQSGYKFVVELVKGYDYEWKAGDTFYASPTVSYANIAYTGGMSSPTVYDFNSFSAVPEPTSGMLFMLGMIALGLKRKKEHV